MKNVKHLETTKDLKYILNESQNLDVKSKEEENNTKLKINLNKSIKKQKIIGMGYSFEHSSCFNLLQLSPKDRKRALKALIDPNEGAGMNLWRLCIGTSDFTGTNWYTYCDEPPKLNKEPIQHINESFSLKRDKELIVPIVQESQNMYPDIKFFASPWSPPAWMKDSNSLCGGRLLKKYWKAYAYYLIKYIKEYQKLGIQIHAITIQNEPLHNTKNMPSCSWNWKGREERDFLKKHLGPMIKEENLKTEIWIYDHNWDDIPFRAAKYPQTILDDPKAVKFADGIAFHHYSALGWSSPKMMKKFRKKYPSIPFYFTEGSVFGLWGALRLARYLRYGSSSYNGWVSILDTEGNPNNGPFNPSQTLIQRQPKTNTCIKGFDYYMHVHFMRFIRAGARYLHAKRPRRWGFEIIAFQNKDSQKVVVAINRRRWKRNITIKLGKWSIRTRLRPRSINTILINKIINS